MNLNEHILKIRQMIRLLNESDYNIESEYVDNMVGTHYELKSDNGRASGNISDFSIEPKDMSKFDYKTISVARLDAKEIGKQMGYKTLLQVLDYAKQNGVVIIESTSLNDYSRKTFELAEKNGLIYPLYNGLHGKTIAWIIKGPYTMKAYERTKKEGGNSEFINAVEKMINMNLNEHILKIRQMMGLNESFSSISKEEWINSRKNGIKKELGDNFLTKAEANPNYVFLLASDLKNVDYGDMNKCETNTYNYVIDGIRNNRKIYPVGGFAFNESYFPVEHWWVYDADENIFLEITPMHPEVKIRCYAGIIGYEVRQELIENKAVEGKPWDYSFFKGGYIERNYFR